MDGWAGWGGATDGVQLHLDGVNQYETIFEDGPAARDEILLQYDPPTYINGSFTGLQAAYRLNEWKLIRGKVCLRAVPASLESDPPPSQTARPASTGRIRLLSEWILAHPAGCLSTALRSRLRLSSIWSGSSILPRILSSRTTLPVSFQTWYNDC